VLLGVMPTTFMIMTMQPVNCPFSYARQDDGAWKFNAQGPGPCLMFMTNGTYYGIPGAHQCDAWLGVYVADGGPFPPAGLTVDDVKALRKSGSQQVLEDMAAAHAPEDQQRAARAVLGMIIRGQKEERGGALLLLRPYLVGLGVALLFLAAVVAKVRLKRRRGYERRLALGASGICPRCEYEMEGLEEGVCPECGLDVSHDVRESREKLGQSLAS
jgi:hypothetical protein